MVGILHKFKLIDKRTFKLPPDNNYSITHLATVKWNMREFVYLRINQTGQTYIEEVVLKPAFSGGKMIAKYELIEDDNLWQDLAGFLAENGLTDMDLPYTNPFKQE